MGTNNNSLLSGSTGYEDPFSTNTPLNDLEKQLQDILMQQKLSGMYGGQPNTQPMGQNQQSQIDMPSIDSIKSLFGSGSSSTVNPEYMQLGADEAAAWGYPAEEAGAYGLGEGLSTGASGGMMSGLGKAVPYVGWAMLIRDLLGKTGLVKGDTFSDVGGNIERIGDTFNSPEDFVSNNLTGFGGGGLYKVSEGLTDKLKDVTSQKWFKWAMPLESLLSKIWK
jgi:hypothetical protein